MAQENITASEDRERGLRSGKDRRRRSDVRGQMSGRDRGRRAGRRKTEDGERKSDVGDQGSGFDIKIKDTFDLIKKIEDGELPDKIMINVHPQRWADDIAPWVKELVWQNFKNVIKKWMIKFRN